MPSPLQVDLESGVRVTWPTRGLPLPILVFLGLSVLDLGPMYATDVRRASSLNFPCPRGHNKLMDYKLYTCQVIRRQSNCNN